MDGDTYSVTFDIPEAGFSDRLGQPLSQEEFLALVWVELKQEGLLGIQEGTQVPGPQASGHNLEQVRLYFSSHAAAQKAQTLLSRGFALEEAQIHYHAEQDWNAPWNAQFQGLALPPLVEIISEGQAARFPELLPLYINVGAGFGSGTHETTQLCLEGLGALGDLTGKTVLDMGCGSGILGVFAGLKGANVDAVDIDLQALKNASHNASLNQVYIETSQKLPSGPRHGYDVIVANILAETLENLADSLCQRLKHPGGHLFLSGLLQHDIEDISQTYAQKLPAPHIVSYSQKGEWFAIHFKMG